MHLYLVISVITAFAIQPKVNLWRVDFIYARKYCSHDIKVIRGHIESINGLVKNQRVREVRFSYIYSYYYIYTILMVSGFFFSGPLSNTSFVDIITNRLYFISFIEENFVSLITERKDNKIQLFYFKL